MSKPKLSSKPPVRSVEEFIAEADHRQMGDDSSSLPSSVEPRPVRPPSTKSQALETPSLLPWERPSVRDDVLKTYNLRLPEPYLLKLRYIASLTPDSMQQFCLKLLLPAIDEQVALIRASGDGRAI